MTQPNINSECSLAQQLQDDGLESVIDDFDNNPSEGWPMWMERQFQHADFVLVVCSPTYHQRYNGEEKPGQGLGGVWESRLLRQELYEGQGINRKFIPVLFEGAAVKDIPLILRQYTHYRLMTDYDKLLQYLTSQPNTAATVGSDKFSQILIDHMASLSRQVEFLTQEQFRTIQMLKYFNRLRISGCAGSGKTLVAAEKAIRLSRAGVDTLFLCHNPLLAKHVAQLTQGSGVMVQSFGDWLTHLTGRVPDHDSDNWTNYDEPDRQTLEDAYLALAEGKSGFDAVIVDEGQDFRNSWWDIVEASLKNTETGRLYIFHDDHQALLPHRATYPIKEQIDLSKNCRNAGKIFELMRYLHPGAPMPEDALKNQGKTIVVSYTAGSEKETVENAVRWLWDTGYGANFTLLLGGALTVENSALSGEKISIPTIGPSQDEVKKMFEFTFQKGDKRGVMFPNEGEAGINEKLTSLSQSPLPNSNDIELVRNLARKFTLNHDIRSDIESHPQFRGALRWVVQDGKPRLYRSRHAPIWSAEIIRYFEREDWALGLPEPRVLTLKPYDSTDEGDFIKMYNVAIYKGLEADVVLLLVRGRGPRIEQQMYVGISRARFLLAVLVDKATSSLFPNEWISKTYPAVERRVG